MIVNNIKQRVVDMWAQRRLAKSLHYAANRSPGNGDSWDYNEILKKSTQEDRLTTGYVSWTADAAIHMRKSTSPVACLVISLSLSLSLYVSIYLLSIYLSVYNMYVCYVYLCVAQYSCTPITETVLVNGTPSTHYIKEGLDNWYLQDIFGCMERKNLVVASA